MSEQSSEQQDNALSNYYDWQVMTLMLAHDLADPIPPRHEERVKHRRAEVAKEVGEMVMDLLPAEYRENPEKDFTPELMMAITRATLRRAAEIAGVQPESR